MRADPKKVSPKVELAREEAHYARHVKRLQTARPLVNTTAPLTPPHFEFARQSMQKDRIYAERMSRTLFSEIPGNGKKRKKLETNDGVLPQWYWDTLYLQSTRYPQRRNEFSETYGSRNTSQSPGKVFLTQEKTARSRKQNGSSTDSSYVFGDVGQTIDLDTSKTPRRSSRSVMQEMEERAMRLNGRNRKKTEPRRARIQVKHLRPKIALTEVHNFEIPEEDSSVRIGFDSPMPQWGLVSESPKHSIVDIKPSKEQQNTDETSSTYDTDGETPQNPLRDMDTQHESPRNEGEDVMKHTSTMVDNDSELDTQRNNSRRKGRRKSDRRRHRRRTYSYSYSDDYSDDEGKDKSVGRGQKNKSETASYYYSYSSSSSYSESEYDYESSRDSESGSSEESRSGSGRGRHRSPPKRKVKSPEKRVKHKRAQKNEEECEQERQSSEQLVIEDSLISDSKASSSEVESSHDQEKHVHSEAHSNVDEVRDEISIQAQGDDLTDKENKSSTEHSQNGEKSDNSKEEIIQIERPDSLELENSETRDSSNEEIIQIERHQKEDSEKSGSSRIEAKHSTKHEDGQKRGSSRIEAKHSTKTEHGQKRDSSNESDSQIQTQDSSNPENTQKSDSSHEDTTQIETKHSIKHEQDITVVSRQADSASEHASESHILMEKYDSLEPEKDDMEESQELLDTNEEETVLEQTNDLESVETISMHKVENDSTHRIDSDIHESTQQNNSAQENEQDKVANAPPELKDKIDSLERATDTKFDSHSHKNVDIAINTEITPLVVEELPLQTNSQDSPKDNRSSDHRHRSARKDGPSRDGRSTSGYSTTRSSRKSGRETSRTSGTEERSSRHRRKRKKRQSTDSSELSAIEMQIIPMIPCNENDVLALDSDLIVEPQPLVSASSEESSSPPPSEKPTPRVIKLKRETFGGIDVPETVELENPPNSASLEQSGQVTEQSLTTSFGQGLRNPATFRFASARVPVPNYSPNSTLIQFDNLVSRFLTSTGKFEDGDGYDLRPTTRREDDVIRATVGIPKIGATTSRVSRGMASSMRSAPARGEPKTPKTAKTRTTGVRWLQ